MKYSFEEVKNYFENYGCYILDSEYKNCHTKLKYRCICGEIWETSFSGFKYGQRCKRCRYEKTSLRFRLNYSFVKDYFKDHNCELLEDEYKNAHIKMKYKCNCGDISYISFDSFKQGNRCKSCGFIKISESNKLKIGDKHPRWIKDRDKKAENDLFCARCRTMIRSVLKRLSLKKLEKTEELLGYKISCLKTHIEGSKEWDQLKNKTWHIDHIFPLKAFIDYDIKDAKLVNCLENLQPLLDSDNFFKHAKYNCLDFENWLISKGVILH